MRQASRLNQVLTRLTLVLCLLTAHGGRGQGTAYFNRRYAFPTDTVSAQSAALALTATDSGYATFGQGHLNGQPGYSLLLRFLDSQGRVRRVRAYGQVGHAYYAPSWGNGEILSHPAGGYIMAGTTEAPGRQQHAMLWRFTATGDTLWTRTY